MKSSKLVWFSSTLIPAILVLAFLTLPTFVRDAGFPVNSRDSHDARVESLLGPVDDYALQMERIEKNLSAPVAEELNLLLDEIKVIGNLKAFGMGDVSERHERIREAFRYLGPRAAPLDSQLREEFLKGRNPFDSGYALARIGGEAWLVITRGLESGNEDVRLAVAGMMGDAPGSVAVKALPRLIECLEEENRILRLSALLSLGKLAVDAELIIVPLVETVMSDPDWVVRTQAAKSLGYLGVRESALRDRIEDVLKQVSNMDNERAVRTAAGSALNELRNAER